VLRILTSETYAGRWYFGKRRAVKEQELDPKALEIIKARNPKLSRRKQGQNYVIENPRDYWLALDVPALVDDAAWQAVQDQLAANRRNAWRRTDEEYLLRNLLTCGKCGAGVQCDSSVGAGSTRYRYYCCVAKRARLTYARKCDQRAFRADWVEAEVWNWIYELLTMPDKLRKALAEVEAEGERKAAPTRRRITTLDELIAENTAELGRVKEMCQRGLYTMDEAAGKKVQLEETLGQLRRERDRLNASLQRQIRGGKQVLAVLQFAEAQGPNVERATGSFAVRRGLMEDLEVEATLTIDENGVPVVLATSVFGEKTFREHDHTTSVRRVAGASAVTAWDG
jgi:site-specific DNA recombinase